jgi:hypothetical protein
MKPPLSDEHVAKLVSNVTQTMLGLRFGLAPLAEVSADLVWRAALLDIGDRSMSVALSSSQAGCTILGAALFACAAGAVDASMMNDSLAELVNMTAGQIKGALMLDHALGLPRVLESKERLDAAGCWRVIRLRGGSVDLLVWMTEPDPKNKNHGAGK